MRLQLSFLPSNERITVVKADTRQQENWTVVDNTNGLLKFVADDGRRVTRTNGWFYPALEWDDQGEQGTSVVDWELGSLWPLEVGNRAYYHRISTLSDGTKREENWRCRVESFGKVQMEQSGNSHDAFKIVCVSETNIHTWYWSPQYITPIRYERTSAHDGRTIEKIEKFGT